ncbi:TIGR01777 family oxidoreductase [Pseudochryseolinea flava]|uniref:TIGR01777 family protein n=1 Tax=Pseudochryseolinea flava TaxID=2059302 RepID=A0A364YDA5_9BACT|nr:TIGR01777 family oxidoreductase [Pseudochryseolinea flava]RAW03558.1 TIGR01777 family protein [Pseudochryseolinea flava]
MKIIIAGGSGYIGTVLCDFYKDKASEIIILSRRVEKTEAPIRTVLWDATTLGEWKHELENADMLVNLVGKSVNCRYTEENKNEILRSRIASTHILGEAVQQLKSPPSLWIQSSSATIYRHSIDLMMTEAEGEKGSNFSENACVKWENTFNTIPLSRTRGVILRTSIVLGRRDGAFPRLMNLVRAGLGGQQGSGEQFVSWIHERDFVNVIEWIRTHPTACGIYNCASMQPVTNKEFMNSLCKAMHVPFALPAPEFLLRWGAKIIGTETELILKSRKVYPERLLDHGFVFEFPDLKSALVDLCRRERKS